MTAWMFLRTFFPHLWSREKNGFATNSEKKRWLLNGAVIINGERVGWDEVIDFPIFSFVLFPKGGKVTLW